jgi:hypothetical protein
MNTKRNFLTAAATTAIVGLTSVAPTQAASFGTSGISFYEDTTVDFEFLPESCRTFTSSELKSIMKLVRWRQRDLLIWDYDLFGEVTSCTILASGPRIYTAWFRLL